MPAVTASCCGAGVPPAPTNVVTPLSGTPHFLRQGSALVPRCQPSQAPSWLRLLSAGSAWQSACKQLQSCSNHFSSRLPLRPEMAVRQILPHPSPLPVGRWTDQPGLVPGSSGAKTATPPSENQRRPTLYLWSQIDESSSKHRTLQSKRLWGGAGMESSLFLKGGLEMHSPGRQRCASPGKQSRSEAVRSHPRT